METQDILALLIEENDVYFDPAKENSSLYLCFSKETPEQDVMKVVDHMKTESAWISEVKAIKPEQKSAYITQLLFSECFRGEVADVEFVAVKATHPKYPVSDVQWEKWRSAARPA